MKEANNINFYLSKLSIEEIERFLILNDNNLFEKLSTRVNIHEYSKKLYENALHFTLYKHENLVGFSPCYFNNEEKESAYISALIIRKSYQGLGLEEKLLGYIKEFSKHNKFNQILVSFHCRNSQSVEFYKNNSFTKFDQNKDICIFKYDQDNN